MKVLYLRTLVVTTILFLSSASMYALNPREKSIGPKLGYISKNNSAVAGLVFRYNLSSHLRVSPEIGCAFRHESMDAFLVDLNFHTPFGISDTNKAAIYPMGGITFNAWSHHGIKDHFGESYDVTSHINRFGINAGAGFELNCSATLKLNIEAKYSLVKAYSSFIITAGISYIF